MQTPMQTQMQTPMQNIFNTINATANKTSATPVDMSQASWAFDPIINGFKLNCNINGQVLPASNGFYIINAGASGTVNAQAQSQSTYYFDAVGKMVTGFVKTPDLSLIHI